MATLRSARAGELGLLERGRATLLGLLAGVALVVVASAVVLWLREPGATIAKAAPRDVAAEVPDVPDQRPAAATAPAAPEPTREKAPLTRSPFELSVAHTARRLDESEPIAKATLAVRVVQAATGEPCAKFWLATDVDRTLSLAKVPSSAYAVAAGAGRFTDADGRAELVFPADVALVVTVASPLHGVANLEQKIEPLEADERRVLTIAMALPTPNRACLRCVAAATGAPIGGATLARGNEPIGVSDGDGRFVIVFDREHADPIVARAAGFATGVVGWEEVRLSTEAAPCELRLEPGATIDATLADAGGVAMGGVPLHVVPDSRRFDGRDDAPSRSPLRRQEEARRHAGMTDANGRVRLENLAVGVPLDVVIGRDAYTIDFGSRWPHVRVVLAAGETRRLDVRQLATATVRGRVVGSTAVPTRVFASDREITGLLPPDSFDDESMIGLARRFGFAVGVCTEGGSFEIAEVVPGRVALMAVAPDGATLAATSLELHEGEVREGVELTVARTRIRCLVTRDGAAVARAHVSCGDRSPLQKKLTSALTDSDGRCELTVANVPFHLIVRAGRQQVVRSLLAPPAETIELELGGGGEARTRTPRIVGRVASDSADDGSSIVVAALRHDAVECRRDAVALVRANPSFAFDDLAAGTWDLTFTTSGHFASLPGVTVQAGATANVGDVALRDGAALDVTFALDPASTLQLEQDDATLLVRHGEVRLALVLLARGETAHLAVPIGPATLELRRAGQWIDGREVVLSAEGKTAVTLGAR
jgi:hypothetical protein